jgi:ribosomal protein S18 acetylase RimI-like enzyme
VTDPASEAIAIRAWNRCDHDGVQGLLRLLSRDAEITSHDAPTYVAEDGEQLVGMVTLCVYSTLTGPKAYLDHLVVAPNWRRRGIARRLVQHAIEQADAAGASRVDLTANDTKQAARALYESLGFQMRDTGVCRLRL